MQFGSFPPVFDSESFTCEHPFSPEGYLFTYYPQLQPDTLHYHDFLELGYCEWGSGLFYVDGKAIPFNGPCCSIIYSGQIHIAQSINEEKSLWHFLYIDMKSLFSGAHLMSVGKLKAFSSHLYDFPALIPKKQDLYLYQLCVDIMQEAAEMKEQYLTAIRGLTTALLVCHSRYMTPAAAGRKDQDELLSRLRKVLEYINQHYMEDISVGSMVQECGVSKSTLRRDLLAFTGKAPMQYIHYLRMKRAALLLQKKIPVSDVAYDVGYNSISSFNRHFLVEFGVSPTRWIRENENVIDG